MAPNELAMTDENRTSKNLYRFDDVAVDCESFRVQKAGRKVSLTPRAFDVLTLLLRNSGRVVEKQEIFDQVWKGTFVSDNALTKVVKEIRHTLEDDAARPRYIETVPKHGYRFIAEIEIENDPRQQTITVIPSASLDSSQARSSEASPLAINRQASLLDLDSRISASIKSSLLKRYPALAVITGLILLTLTFLALHTFLKAGKTMAAARFQHTKIMKLTTDGNAVRAVILPDGKYVAYVLRDRSSQSLRLRQANIANDVELIAPGQFVFQWLGLGPDGTQIYFNGSRVNQPGGLFRIPTLGGAPTLVKPGAVRFGSFSPDGKQLVYRSPNREARQEFLGIADPDFTSSRQLIARTKPAWMGGPGGGLDWSPDGLSVASAATIVEGGDTHSNILDVRVSDGVERALLRDRWFDIGALNWLPDKSGIVFIGQKADEPFTQVWLLTLSTGEVRKITNDLNNYSGASLSGDARSFVTMRTETVANIWTAANEKNPLSQITNGTGNYTSPTLAPDGKILYASDATGSADIWEMNADGTHARQLTSNAQHNYTPIATPDNRYIVFQSDHGGSRNIWRMNRDGSNAIQLTHGERETSHPVCSPNSRWVFYQGEGGAEKLERVWRISIDGGGPVQVADDISSRPTVSPDGKLVAYWKAPLDSFNWRVEVVPFDGGTTIKTLEIPATAQRGTGLFNSFQFTPDGRALTYIDTRDNVSNLWLLPLDNSPPRPLTNFKDGFIYSFAWSPDGKLVCARGHATTDAVLINDAG